MKPRLYIFAKAPHMGRVKTRLAKDAGPVHALRIYRVMTARILREMRDPRWQTILYVTPARMIEQDFGGLWPRHMMRLAQPAGGLSERTDFLFQDLGPAICIGTDTPSMRKAYIAEGFTALKHKPAVIGSARDGGFWALGLNGPAKPGLFDSIRWSHPQTCADLRTSLACEIHDLPLLEDIDTVQAWQNYRTG